MADREEVIKALSICVPETQDDSRLECSDCPYGDVCNPNDIVGITLPLIWDIRALLKEQEDEKKRVMKVIWDTLHEGLSIDTIPDQDWVYELIRHRIEDT